MTTSVEIQAANVPSQMRSVSGMLTSIVSMSLENLHQIINSRWYTVCTCTSTCTLYVHVHKQLWQRLRLEPTTYYSKLLYDELHADWCTCMTLFKCTCTCKTIDIDVYLHVHVRNALNTGSINKHLLTILPRGVVSKNDMGARRMLRSRSPWSRRDALTQLMANEIAWPIVPIAAQNTPVTQVNGLRQCMYDLLGKQHQHRL